jgi:hypothetical protein
MNNSGPTRSRSRPPNSYTTSRDTTGGAAAQPSAYAPTLANALNDRAFHLSNVGHHQEALQVAEEAVRTLAPRFLAQPVALASSMRSLVGNYEFRCKETGTNADMELLTPIQELLKRMQEGTGGKA